MKKLLLLMSLLSFLGLSASAVPIEIGAPVPEVSAVDQAGKSLALQDLAATGYTLVYFYPKADTPGCTAQACSLRDAYTALQAKGVRVIGVSADTVEGQAKFKEKYNLPFELLADSDHKVIDAFGVPRIPVVGFATRQAYLFKDGVLVWRDLSASTKQQADDVLKVVEAK